MRVFYIHNGLADVVALVDEFGNIIARYYYDAFGVIVEETGDFANPFRYRGKIWDETTGLYYLRMRFYNPAIARFMSVDPYWGPHNMLFGSNPREIGGVRAPNQLAIMQALNLYAYVVNNPVRYIDPWGLNIPEDERGQVIFMQHGLMGDATFFQPTVENLINHTDGNYISLGIVTAGRGNDGGWYYNPNAGNAAGIYWNDNVRQIMRDEFGQSAWDNPDQYASRIINHLVGQGYNVIIRTEFSAPNLSFEEQRIELRDMVRRFDRVAIRDEELGRDVIERFRADVTFVGYSMGGLISLSYGMDHAIANSNRQVNVITVATPFHPNPWALSVWHGPQGAATVAGHSRGLAHRDLGGVGNALTNIHSRWNNFNRSNITLNAIAVSMYSREQRNWSDIGDGIASIPSQQGEWWRNVNTQPVIFGTGTSGWRIASPLRAMDTDNAFHHSNVGSLRQVATQINNLI